MNKSILHVAGFFVIVMLTASVWGWLRLPEHAMLPIHWGPDLKPDSFTSKTTGLLFLPLLALAIGVVLALAPRFEPRRDNLLRSGRAYVAVQFAVLAFFTLLHLAVIMQASGSGISMETVLPIGLGLLFGAIGNVMGKVRSNFILGIRTPWTLSSELAWNKTHRVCGRLFVVYGALMVLLGLAAPQLVVYVTVSGLLAIVAVGYGYSFLVWKNDPTRRGDPA